MYLHCDRTCFIKKKNPKRDLSLKTNLAVWCDFHLLLFFKGGRNSPGAMIPSVKGDVLLNAQRRTIKLKVTSLCDRPIQVCLAIFCSCVHLEVNNEKLTIASCVICIMICLRCSKYFISLYETQLMHESKVFFKLAELKWILSWNSNQTQIAN